MKRILLLVIAASIIIFSGCLDQKTVKTGDNISVDYIGSFQDGKVFDTSLESVAKENQLYDPEKKYTPLRFTVGNNEVIKGMDEGVIGMKVGDSRKLTIPPEKGYGLIKPELISRYDIIQNISAKENTFPRDLNISLEEFEATFGPGHNKSDTVVIPGTNINLTINNISSNVSLSYDLKEGSQIFSQNALWNMTVIKIDNKNITIKPAVKLNDTIQLPFDQFQKSPWTSTVIGVNNANITLRHNAIPETMIRSMFGNIKVKFNETSFTLDENNELAGKTLIFNVTLKSIETGKSDTGKTK